MLVALGCDGELRCLVSTFHQDILELLHSYLNRSQGKCTWPAIWERPPQCIFYVLRTQREQVIRPLYHHGNPDRGGA